MYRLPKELECRDPLVVEVQVVGVEGIKDSSKNRDRVEAKLGKSGLEVVVTDCSTSGLLLAHFSYAGKSVSFSKRKDFFFLGLAQTP